MAIAELTVDIERLSSLANDFTKLGYDFLSSPRRGDKAASARNSLASLRRAIALLKGERQQHEYVRNIGE